MNISLRKLRRSLSKVGVGLRHEAGEIMIFPKGDPDHPASYFTNDREDALHTGREMARQLGICPLVPGMTAGEIYTL